MLMRRNMYHSKSLINAFSHKPESKSTIPITILIDNTECSGNEFNNMNLNNL